MEENTYTKPQAIRENGKITSYIYRDVKITRIEGGFEFTIDRYDQTIVQKWVRRLVQIEAVIDATLDQQGRSTGGKPVVATVVNGIVVTALSYSDWRCPNARLVVAK